MKCASIRMISALFLLCALAGPVFAQGNAPTLVINEFMAQNTSSIQDSHGDYDDWLELFNYGNSAIDVAGYCLTDDLTNATKWQIPTGDSSLTTIPAHGFLLIWADDEARQGPLHAGFKLSAGGESLGLYDAQGNLLDSVTFDVQEPDVSSGRLPDGADQWQQFSTPTPGKSNQAAATRVVISEIMFHPPHIAPAPEDRRQEWIELFNAGGTSVNLRDWRLSDGVEYVFPDAVLKPGEYLVVAADTGVFSTGHPDVTNVVGGWTGWLSNSGERITLVDEVGGVMDEIRYADEGDWAVRELGPVAQSHRGWEWSEQTDGGGRSLELISAAMANESGQNWAAGLMDEGTPGAANSVAADDVAPLILKVQHSPVIPKPIDPVTIVARVVDESIATATVRLQYRQDRSVYGGTGVYPETGTDFIALTMFDDGTNGDDTAGDGLYTTRVPPQPDGTIVEFYVEAVDDGGNARTWPAPSLVDDQWRQVTNALYRVYTTIHPATYWQPGGQPLYYVIMTEMERGRLAYIGTHSGSDGPDTTMNATFISIDGAGVELCYGAGIRNRGHGTRNGPPNNYHVSFPRDRLWKGLSAINFNCRYTHAQIIGSALFRMAGVAAAETVPAQLRINGANLAYPGSPMFGVYARFDAFDDGFAAKHVPGDPDGNLYTCFRVGTNEADLRYEGTDPDRYRNRYFKANHAGQDDWSDLIHLVDVLNNAPDATYEQEVDQVVNISQWLHYIALDALLMNYETGLRMGIGDDYFMYRGATDPRFVLVPHDLDTILDQGNTHGAVDQSIFTIVTGVPNSSWNGVEGLRRFFSRPEIIRRYYQAVLDVTGGLLRPEKLDPLLDQVIGKFTPADRITAMKQFAQRRRDAALAQVPQTITVTNAPAQQDGYAHARANAISLTGRAHAVHTRRVTVNGRPAVWTPLDATWSADNVGILPGINRIVIQAFDANDGEIDRSSIDVWCETGALTVKAGGTLSADETWTAAGTPYHVTGNINIPAGRTLRIEPGVTVFLDADVGFTVHGRLVAQGTEYRRIRFTRPLGTTAQWAGFQIPDSAQDNIIAYADLEYGGSRSHWITTGNSDAGAVGPTARLTVDHATFRGSDTRYFSIWDPQIVIRDSVFADLGSHNMIVAERMPADGWFIIANNLFGHTHGDTDVLRLNAVSIKGGPVARILNNVFTGSGDDLLDAQATDACVEGNLFMYADPGHVSGSESAAIAAGAGGLQSQHLTAVRNIFFRSSYGIQAAAGVDAKIGNSVFIGNDGAILFDEPGGAAHVENCIFWNDGVGAFITHQNAQLTVNNCVVPAEFLDLGTGNIDADPLLVDVDRELHIDMTLPRFGAGFQGFAECEYLLTGMIPDVHLRPESSARGAGFNGEEPGFYAPASVSLAGVPASPTWKTNVVLTADGVDVYGLKYRVAGPGFDNAWSAEMAGKPQTIRLSGLTNGVYTISVIRKNFLGLWQQDSEATTATWTVDTSYRRLLINEVLAVNETAFDHEGTFPDLVELYYDGPTTLSLAGMGLSDDPMQPDKFVFPTGATMASGEHLVLFADANAVTSGMHLGFALAQEGDGVYLYDRSGALLDSVEFGRQLPDLSIGRTGPDGQWQLAIPTFGQTNVACPRGSVGTLRINEWLASGQVLFADDFIELYNPHSDPVDLGGLYLTDNPVTQPDKHALRPLTFIAGQSCGAFWADDSDDPGHLGFRLSADGGLIGLFDKQVKEIDKVVYTAQTPDVSEGRSPDGGDHVELLPLPTPGLVNPQAKRTTTTTTVLLGEQASKRVLVPTDAISDDWRGGKAFDDSDWALCTGGPGGVGFDRGSDYDSLITLDTEAQMYGAGNNNSCYLRIPFTATAKVLAGAGRLMLKVRCDDAFIAYLNGKEVGRDNFTGTPEWNSKADSSGESAGEDFDQYVDITPYIADLKTGTNILAIHAMNSGTSSSDFLINVAIDVISTIVEGNDAYERELALLSGLRITELMYHASQGGGADYVELMNAGDQVLDVNGVRFSNGIDFTFSSMTLRPGEYVVVVADAAAFQSAYGSGANVVGQYDGSLNNGGEELVLQLPAPLDAAILRFKYCNTWYPQTDGRGESLAILDPGAAPARWNDPESWQGSTPTPGGP